MYQHHVMVKTAEPLDSEDAINWYKTVKDFGPEGVVYSYFEKDEPVAMEYGVREDEEFSHCYVVPLIRDLTQDETLFVVEAWQYMFDGDFDIEI